MHGTVSLKNELGSVANTAAQHKAGPIRLVRAYGTNHQGNHENVHPSK